MKKSKSQRGDKTPLARCIKIVKEKLGLVNLEN